MRTCWAGLMAVTQALGEGQGQSWSMNGGAVSACHRASVLENLCSLWGILFFLPNCYGIS